MIRMLSLSLAAAALLATACGGGQKMFRSNAELAPRIVAAPAATVPAKITRDAEVRSSPHELSPVLHRLPAGTEVVASESSTRGWRRVKTADGKGGYVRDVAVELTAAAATPAPTEGNAAGAPAP